MLKRLDKGLQADLGMLMVALVWGATFVITKQALLDIGPFMFLGIRFLLAFLVLVLLSFGHLRKINKQTVLTGIFIGFFLFVGYIFQTVGLQYTTSSNAGFITGLSVVLVPLLYHLLERSVPHWSTLLSAATAALGLFLMSVPAGSFRPGYGDLLVLGCAVGFAVHIILVDRYSHNFGATAITAVQIFTVGILCLAIGLVVEPGRIVLTVPVIKAILITSIFATSLAFLIQNAMQKYSTPTRFAVVLAMEPVFAGVAGYWWAGEVLSSRAYLGALLILLAMLIAILIARK